MQLPAWLCIHQRRRRWKPIAHKNSNERGAHPLYLKASARSVEYYLMKKNLCMKRKRSRRTI